MIEIRDIYAALVESSEDAIVSKDTDGIVHSWNPAAELLFGYSAEEMIGESIRKLLPADRQDEEDRILSRIRAGDKVGQFFTKRRHKSGHLIDVSVTVSPVRDPSGAIVGASKIARDAGPVLEGQRRLRESEERFRMLADNINQFAWIARPDGYITWYNQRWYDYTGTTLDQVQGSGWRCVHHPDHVDRVEQHFMDSLAEGTEWEDTFPLRSAEGEYRWFLSRAMPIRNDRGEVVSWFGTNTDITEQREQAEQIRLLLMEVNHRSKNMLSTVQALARRTARHDTDFIARFEDRVRSLAVNQDILVRRDWREVPVEELVRLQLHFIDIASGAVSIAGPPLALIPRAAEVIGMALHELATNSLKYGALSAGGRVEIGWRDPSEAGSFSIWWHESGGPPVAKPERTGFGTTLIADVPRHNLGAEVELDYAPGGVRWCVRCDPAVVAGHTPAPGAAPSA
ncbi:histidine kinase [Altererythrobacter sp. B11]|uniref:PAS domain S-box protein n=1 Tax=Altererythrobacter sp. B11 TaxID=2060312 RepID=UPI000DC6E8A5|nr:PAS domain S-box protein [Altererythrobacter sp. B11]BBC72387.1 histidine kinase [Altererythrobacter sp. B11]